MSHELQILVRDVEQALLFQSSVLGGVVETRAERRACVRHGALRVVLVQDAAAEVPGLTELVGLVVRRGAGALVRLEVDDPAAHALRARQAGFSIFDAAVPRPDGRAEVLLCDGDGYLWAVTAAR